MLEAAASLVSTTNPGLILMAAGIIMVFMRGFAPRAAVLVGGPVLALATLLSSGSWGVDLATFDAFGLTLSLYRIDSLSFIFGLAFIIAAAIGGIYSLHREDGVQDGAGMLYAGAAIAAIFAGDLITLFIFWELTAITSVVLIWARRTPQAYAAGLRYLIIQMTSGLLLIAGAALYHNATELIAFSEMGAVGELPVVSAIDIAEPGAWLMLIAFGVKAAFPLAHSWLQDAYPNSTETGTVILSAFTTKLAIYALARGFAGLDLLIWVGAIMAVFPVFFALLGNDLRRVLSYALISQMGIMVCAVGVGGELGVNGAAAHAFASTIYMALLFMSMGAVMLRTGTTKASEIGGLHRTMPYTTLFAIIGGATIASVPLTSGFAAKSLTMSAVGYDGQMWVWLALLFAAAAAVAHTTIKVPLSAFFGEDRGRRPEEAPFNMLLAMGIAAVFCIGIGVTPRWLYELLPYRDTALDYLNQDLWTPTHLVTQFQLLVFGALAFVLLRRYALYPETAPGMLIDSEWAWRRAAPSIAGALGAALMAFERAFARTARQVGGRIKEHLVQTFAPARGVSQRVPLSSTAIWSAFLLAAVLLIALI